MKEESSIQRARSRLTAGLRLDGQEVLYLNKVPRSSDEIPAGKVVVHNNVRPTNVLGSRGFRAWLEPASKKLIPCECDWAPALETHYVNVEIRSVKVSVPPQS